MAHLSYILVVLSLLHITVTYAQTKSLQDQCKLAVGNAYIAGVLAHDEINVQLKQGLISKRLSPELEQKYRSCLMNYLRANEDIGTVGELLNSKNYKLMISAVSSAIAEADACDKSLVEKAGQIKLATKTFEDASRGLLDIVKRLAAGERT